MNIGINQKITYTFLLVVLFFVVTREHTKLILAGVSIFIIGMIFIEDGFRLFSSDILQKAVKNFTNTTAKAIATGFFSTALTQSSSLVSVIVISFLSAQIMGLTAAVGVIFGANIGTTATAWIVSSLGVKIDVAVYALPMVSLGVALRFMTAASLKGVGNLLIGIGFIFLGIGYMKGGFDSLRESIELSKYAIEGFGGIIVYILIGAFATVVTQSSSAAMALVITALITGQINYTNAVAFSIGANIGTTVTAFLGALASNEDGKRLALAHFMFNVVTAVIATTLIYQLIWIVDALSEIVGIQNDYAMKLALFHTIFNILGVAVMLPFLNRFVSFLSQRFVSKRQNEYAPKFLSDAAVEYPSTALPALKDELINFFEVTVNLIAKAMFLHKNESGEYALIPVFEAQKVAVKEEYYTKIKSLYGEIIRYATIAQENMSEADKNTVFEIKTVCRRAVEAIKNSGELQKNIVLYANNEYAAKEYDFYRQAVALILNKTKQLQKLGSMRAKKEIAESIKDAIDKMDISANERIAALIMERKIDSKTASSLINDSGNCININTAVSEMALLIWIGEGDGGGERIF